MPLVRRLVVAILVAFSLSNSYACAMDYARDAEKYRTQAVTVLKWLFPDDHALIDSTEIMIFDGHPLKTGMCGPACMRISTGTIRIMPSAFAYYGVLAHEFGHIKSRHRNTLVATGWFTTENDFGLMERQELEADQTAIRALAGRSISPCYFKQVTDTFMKKYPPEDDPADPYRKIIEKRIAAATAACEAQPLPKH